MRKVFFLLFLIQVGSVWSEPEKPIPFDGLKIWLVADSVKSTTDFFLSTMPNEAKTRYAANQIKIQYRPLYIKDFIEHRPVVTLTDMRGFAFGTLRPSTQTYAYIGYYHEIHGQETIFKITSFSPDDILAKSQKDGFVLGIYDGMLALHGQPGYASAFTEFMIYDKELSEKEEEKIKSYLTARYSLLHDSRFIKSDPAVSTENVINISNVLELSNKNLICSAAKVDDSKTKISRSVDLFRSYDYGGKWSPTIVKILGDNETDDSISPFMYQNVAGIIYFFYCVESSDGYKLAVRFSDDDGYDWSDQHVIDATFSRSRMKVLNNFETAHAVFFAVSRDNASPFLLSSTDLPLAQNTTLKWNMKEVDIAASVENPVLDNCSFAYDNDELYYFFNDKKANIWQCVSKDMGGKWSQPQKVRAGGFGLLNPPQMPLHSYSDDSGVVLCFRNCPKCDTTLRDTIWFSKTDRGNWQTPQIAFYNYDYAGDPQINIRSMNVAGGELKAAVKAGDAAYFCPLNLVKTSDILPEGVGVFELKDEYTQQEVYNIPPLPSFITDSLVLDLSLTGGIFEQEGPVFKIGDKDNKLLLFVEGGRYCMYLKEAEKTALLKTAVITKKNEHQLLIEVDGKADIMRIMVDGAMSGCGEDGACGWTYIPARMGQVTSSQLLTIPPEAHQFINKLSIHYKTDNPAEK